MNIITRLKRLYFTLSWWRQPASLDQDAVCTWKTASQVAKWVHPITDNEKKIHEDLLQFQDMIKQLRGTDVG